jgi:putative DNA primase/helicase
MGIEEKAIVDTPEEENKVVKKWGEFTEAEKEAKRFVAKNHNWGINKIGIVDENTGIITLKEKPNDAGKIFQTKEQAKQFNSKQPIFYDKSGLFWLWNSSLFCWEIVDEVDVLNMIYNSTGQDIISPNKRTEIINSLKQEGRLNIPKPIKKTWIQFKDKIYDYQTGENFVATPEYFVTNPLPYEISFNPETPTMDRIFEQWVGEKNKEMLYEILAYCCVPDYPINRLFCVIGGGLNGKTCLLNLLRKFIGEKNICSTELDTLINSRFEVTRVHKKLACIMGETNFNEISKTSILKKLTGGDLIGFEYKNKNPFEDVNYAKIIIATNNLPTTTDKTIGFYRRWVIIDFPNQFSEKKDILSEIPEEEYNNLASKVIITLNKLMAKREFTNEGTVEERMERYESKSNFLDKFINSFTTEDSTCFITKADFYKKFTEWSKENRFRDLSETSVGLNMKKLGIESGKKYFDWLYDGKGGEARVWFGIKWKN